MVLSEPQLAQNGGCSNCQRPVNSMTEKTKFFQPEKNTNTYSSHWRLSNLKNSFWSQWECSQGS